MTHEDAVEPEDTGYLDTARCAACAAVVMLHVLCTPVVFCQSLYSDAELFLVRLFRNTLNWCVPVFVMISGALLLNPAKELPLKKLFGKYIRRFALVILSFGSLYALMEIVFTERTFRLFMILQAVVAVCTGKTWDHLWYLYMAAGLYMLLPALRIFVASADDRTFRYILAIVFLFSSAVPFASLFTDFRNDLPQISVYVLYALTGYAARFRKIELNFFPSILTLAIFLGYLALIQLPFTGGFFLIENNAALKSVDYSSPLVVLASLAVFSLCKKAHYRPEIVKKLSPLTFGIYVIHPVAINLCYKVLHLTVEHYNLLPSLAVTTAAVFTFSISGTLVMRRLPFVKKYIL